MLDIYPMRLGPSDWRAALAEGLATLLFVFLGAGTVVVTGGLIGEGMSAARLMAIALAHGLAITVLVAATAKVSGGHINPAVTAAAFLAGRISLPKGLLYVVAQLAGAAAGAWLLQSVIPAGGAGTLGAHSLGTGVTLQAALLTEIVLTFVLALTVFATAIDPAGPAHLAPIAIGLAVLVDHLIGVPLTGASMNPARSFGPALLAGVWAGHWIYWAGPLIGAALAAWLYKFFFLSH